MKIFTLGLPLQKRSIFNTNYNTAVPYMLKLSLHNAIFLQASPDSSMDPSLTSEKAVVLPCKYKTGMHKKLKGLADTKP